MLTRTILISLLLLLQSHAAAQGQPDRTGVPVEVVATASEYVPRSTTVSHPGHSYTNCLGNTSYFGQFHSYGDFGSFSGSADTNTHCSTTYSPPTETTLTTYRRVNYTIAKSEQALYLLSCTQTWRPTGRERALIAFIGALDGGSGRDSGAADRAAAKAKGTWSDCPAFAIGTKYTFTVRSTSDARLEDTVEGKPSKPDRLEYLSSAALPVTEPQAAAPPQAQAASAPATARVHIMSTPSGGEIYVDGKFFGNAPSDIALAAGEHIVKVTIGGKEWSRAVQITSGEISLHAEIGSK